MMPTRNPAPATNGYARWFSRVVWLGIAFNLLFIVQDLFTPGFVNMSMGLPVGGPTVWNQAHAWMVLTLSIFYMPAALDPLRNTDYSWLLVLSRFLAAGLWVVISRTTPSFVGWAIGDGAFGVAQGVLLQLAVPAGNRAAPTLGRLFSHFWTWMCRPAVRITLAALVVLGGVSGYILWYHLMRAEPDIDYPSVEDHFKYGAIGLGADSRVPYWIWKVLPDMFPEYLPGPGGWASLGLIYEDGKDLPIGFSRRHIGYDAVEANCALCHTSEFRRTPESKPEVILGGPAHTLDLQSFQGFLYTCAADPRFNPDSLLAAINRIHQLSWVESLIYRYLIIPGTKQGLVEQKIGYAWQASRPQQGRGRTDTFNPTKFNVFHLPDDHTIGTVDLPQVWNQQTRVGMYLHWDGNNNNINERNYAAAMAIGATPKTVLNASFKRVTDFLLTLRPPAYPFPIRKDAADRGQKVFDRECASCHAFGSPNVGQVTPIETIATDRHRLDSFTALLVEKFHSIDNPPFVFDSYRKTNGYANVPIDGIWARAPYLHNGSVPNLRAMLQADKDRPAIFYRGYDVYDPQNAGFVSDGPEAQRVGFRVDTGLPGNSNQGHAYGTALKDAEKADLIEYLRTL
jgi:mono/diheme cytochrome c family protein